MNSNKFNYLEEYWNEWKVERNGTSNNVPGNEGLDFHTDKKGFKFRIYKLFPHITAVGKQISKLNNITQEALVEYAEYKNHGGIPTEEEKQLWNNYAVMRNKHSVLLHLRKFIYSACKGFVNRFNINNGKTFEYFWGYNTKAQIALTRYYSNELGKSFEGNIKKNFKKACNKYYKIIYYLQKKNIFHENRKHIIQYIFGEEYYSSYILNFIKKYNGRAKKIYNYYLRMNPKETIEFGNIFLNNLNKGTNKRNYYAEETFGKTYGKAYELTQFKFKTITERSIKDLCEYVDPMVYINIKKKEQETNSIGVGAVRAGLEFFNNNYESKKQVKFKNESEAIEFKHNKAKRAEFIYRMFKKYLPVLNKKVECNYWGYGNEKHKWMYKRIIQDFNRVFTNEGRYYGTHTSGIELPCWNYNYVPNPNAVNKYIENIDFHKNRIVITKFKNKQEEKKFKHIEGSRIVITIPKEEGWLNNFIDIVFKKTNKGEPIVEWWWVNGKKHRNSLKAKKLN